jgi:hypothetical protein
MKKAFILIWLFLGGEIITACISAIIPNTMILPIVFMAGLAVTCWGYWWHGAIKRYMFNRRKNPLNLTTRLKRSKFRIENQDGKKLSITGRSEILFFSFLTWLVLLVCCIFYLKINPVTEFEIAGVGGFAVMGSLVGLYFSRRKRRMIVKFTPSAKITKVGFVLAPSLLWLLMIWGSSSFTADGWKLGLIFGGALAIPFWLGLALKVRQTGFKKFSWEDGLNTFAKSMRNWNAFSRVAGQYGLMGKGGVSFGNIEKNGSEYRSHYADQLKKERDWKNYLNGY